MELNWSACHMFPFAEIPDGMAPSGPAVPLAHDTAGPAARVVVAAGGPERALHLVKLIGAPFESSSSGILTETVSLTASAAPEGKPPLPFEARICPVEELPAMVRGQHAAVVLVEEQALSPLAILELAGALREQPAWSDVPVVILTVHEPETAVSRRLEEERRPLGHCVTLQWPAEPRTVASVVQTALRARRHQCSLRDREQALARAEQALIESERLAAVGRLAASISHEINGPLEAITNLLYLIEQDAHLSTESGVYVRLASRELDRVSAIAGQTLRFHRQAPHPRRIHADELLEPVLALHKAHLRHANIDVGIETGPHARIFCFEGDIRQVLNNLVSNAVEAMPAGGRLRIRAQQCMDWRTGEHGARIAVADTGHGMSAEVVERIFSAFYTTKGINGSGLGLWISQGLVQKHGGCIRVRSRMRHPSGTVFSFFLPEGRVEEVA